MFRAIVGAILFVAYGIPLILWILGALFGDDSSIGCRIFAIVIIVIISIIV